MSQSYAQLAQKHWAAHRQHQLSLMPDPDVFFAELGREIQERLDLLSLELEGPDVPGEGYLAKVGRLRMARFTAAAQALRELLPPAEQDEQGARGRPNTEPGAGDVLALVDAAAGDGLASGGDEPGPPALPGAGRGPGAAPGLTRQAAAGPVAFRPQAQGDLAPAGASAKLAANMAALRTLRGVGEQGRAADAEQQAVLACWSGRGSLPQVFDTSRSDLEPVRTELRGLLGAEGFRAASRTTLNARYTDAALARAVWDVLTEAGFASTTGRVLEPGCGAGTFLGLAPASATRLVGIELDPTTADVAQALYPHADVRAESFADSRLPEEAAST